MPKRIATTCIALTVALCSCEGAVDYFDPATVPEVNDIEILVPRTSDLNPIVDSIGHHQTTAHPSPPFQGPFRIRCGRGECVRLNVFLRNITPEGAWVAGKSCEEETPFSPIWPLKAKGPLGETRDIRVCCPHNEPCTPVKPTIPGGADLIIGILPNGQLATDLESLETICPEMLAGAKQYPSSIHKRAFTWPESTP
jgi:hypothetical protein